jgi:molybdopterin/thiamine biosynthesis adenylyltransferase
VKVIPHEEVGGPTVIAGYDVILDGTDTFETRYTLNDAAVRAGITVVHASVFRFEGQLTVFTPFEGPCYRCLYPTPRPSSRPAAPWPASWAWCPGSWACSRPRRPSRCCSGSGRRSRAVAAVALDASFTELKLRRDPACPACSDAAVAARGIPGVAEQRARRRQ